MAGNPAREEIGAPETEFTYRRIGHKGAAALEMGNTVDSFEAAVEVGVDMIEPTCCGPGGQADRRSRSRRRPAATAFALTEALDAFRDRPLDEVELDRDPGRPAARRTSRSARGPRAARPGDGLDDGAREHPQAAPDRARPAARLDVSEDQARLDPVRLGLAGDYRRAHCASPPLPRRSSRGGPRSWRSTRSGPTTRSSPRSSSTPRGRSASSCSPGPSTTSPGCASRLRWGSTGSARTTRGSSGGARAVAHSGRGRRRAPGTEDSSAARNRPRKHSEPEPETEEKAPRPE